MVRPICLLQHQDHFAKKETKKYTQQRHQTLEGMFYTGANDHFTADAEEQREEESNRVKESIVKHILAVSNIDINTYEAYEWALIDLAKDLKDVEPNMKLIAKDLREQKKPEIDINKSIANKLQRVFERPWQHTQHNREFAFVNMQKKRAGIIVKRWLVMRDVVDEFEQQIEDQPVINIAERLERNEWVKKEIKNILTGMRLSATKQSKRCMTTLQTKHVRQKSRGGSEIEKMLIHWEQHWNYSINTLNHVIDGDFSFHADRFGKSITAIHYGLGQEAVYQQLYKCPITDERSVFRTISDTLRFEDDIRAEYNLKELRQQQINLNYDRGWWHHTHLYSLHSCVLEMEEL